MADDQKLGLLRLPKELRDDIYVRAFEEEVVAIDEYGAHLAAIGVITSCKQIYNEAIDLYFKHSVFSFIRFRDGFDWIVKMASFYLSKLRMIRYIRFDYGQHFSGDAVASRYAIETVQSVLNDFQRHMREFAVELRPGVLKGTAR